MSVTDDGFILFPSISFCKRRAFDQFPHMLVNFLDPSTRTEENIDSVKQWCIEHIFNRSTVFNLVSHNTKGGPAPYPCTTTSGDNPGKPCSFPFVFPDCSVFPKPTFCKHNASSQPIEYRECILIGRGCHGYPK